MASGPPRVPPKACASGLPVPAPWPLVPPKALPKGWTTTGYAPQAQVGPALAPAPGTAVSNPVAAAMRRGTGLAQARSEEDKRLLLEEEAATEGYERAVADDPTAEPAPARVAMALFQQSIISPSTTPEELSAAWANLRRTEGEAGAVGGADSPRRTDTAHGKGKGDSPRRTETSAAACLGSGGAASSSGGAQTADGNGARDRRDSPRRTDPAHGKGKGKGKTSAKGKTLAKGKGKGKTSAKGKTVDPDALLAAGEGHGLRGASAASRKALRTAHRMSLPSGSRSGALGPSMTSPPPPFCNRVGLTDWKGGNRLSVCHCDQWPQWLSQHGVPSGRATPVTVFQGNTAVDPDDAVRLDGQRGAVVSYYRPSGTASS
jgi:hypothetical protein